VEEDYKKDAEERRRLKKDTGTWHTEDEAAMGIIGGGLEEWLKKEVKDLRNDGTTSLRSVNLPKICFR
jgi:hypothetical protein